MKEAVIDHHDVVKGLLDFANRNGIYSIVVGASTKNHMPRYFSCPFRSFFVVEIVYPLRATACTKNNPSSQVLCEVLLYDYWCFVMFWQYQKI